MSSLTGFLRAAAQRAVDLFGDPNPPDTAPHAVPDDYRPLGQQGSDVTCRADPDGTLIYVSPSSTRLLGWTPAEIVGRNARALVVPEDLHILGEAVGKLASREVDEVTVTTRGLRKEGLPIWLEAKAHMVWDDLARQPQFTVIVLRDISEHKRIEDQLAALALQDELTGLPNRRAFDEGLEREWNRTLRESSHMSLLLLDVDRFKTFNDSYGQQVGDDCLRMVAEAVNGAIRRPLDMAARYGGEEIAVILPATDAAGAMEVAEQVRHAVEALQVLYDGHPDGGGFVTVSVGAATALSRMRGTISMPAALLSAADVALRKAKNGGRNRVETALVLPPADGAR